MNDDFNFDSFANCGLNHPFDNSSVEQWHHWSDPTASAFNFIEQLDPMAESYNLSTTDPTAIGLRLQRELLEMVVDSGDEAVATSMMYHSICNGTVNPEGYFGYEAWTCLSSDEQEFWDDLWAKEAAAIALAQRMADELTSAMIEAALIKNQWPEDYFGEQWAALHPNTQTDLFDCWNRLATLDKERLDDAIESWLDHICAPQTLSDDEEVDDWDCFADHDKADASKFAYYLSEALRRRLEYSGTEDSSGWMRPTEEEWSRMPPGHMQSYNAAYESFAEMVDLKLPADAEACCAAAEAHEQMVRTAELLAAMKAPRRQLRIVPEPT